MQISKGSTGTDLSLMHLSPTEIGGLDDDTWWDYEDQLQHHCIRLAWKKAAIQKLPVRECLSVIYGKRFIESEKARGNHVNHFELSQRLEELRSHHELVLSIGYLVDAEADRIVRGAEAPTYPCDESILKLGGRQGELSCYMFAAIALRHLYRIMAEFRRLREELYAAETVRIVGLYANRPDNSRGTPRLDKLLEIVEERAAKERAIAASVRVYR